VDIALESGKMFEGAGWKYISEAFKDNTVHFIGLLSDGGVHSRVDQLMGTLKVREMQRPSISESLRSV
jgi:2,3-bisphosphoglycerate-independent phosphoglycerate mutase